MGKASKQSGRCIFCGGTGLSKQHVFPDWLKKVLPRDETINTQSTLRMTVPAEKTVVVGPPEVATRQGHLGTRKLRIVCERCNNGWMSRLENEARTCVTHMITGASFHLGADQQSALASWAMLLAIVAEFTDRITLSVPATDRKSLMTTLVPPARTWRIFVARCRAPEWRFRYRHHGLSLVDITGLTNIPRGPVVPPPYSSSAPTCNTQASTFGIGELLIHAVSSSVLDWDDMIAASSDNTRLQIWPFVAEANWPFSHELSGDDALRLSDSLHNVMMSNAR